MVELSLDTVSDRLGELFASEEVVRRGYVFGSLADGKTGPLCDVDVGVLVEASALEEVTACCARLAHEGRSVLGTSTVDLVLLN